MSHEPHTSQSFKDIPTLLGSLSSIYTQRLTLQTNILKFTLAHDLPENLPPLLSFSSHATNPFELKYQHWGPGLLKFSTQWHQILASWLRPAKILSQWPFSQYLIEPRNEDIFAAFTKIQKHMHVWDVKAGECLVQLAVLFHELEEFTRTPRERVSPCIIEYLWRYRPNIVHVTRGIATSEFLSLWIAMNAWWREVEELYLRDMEAKREGLREHHEMLDTVGAVLEGMRSLIGQRQGLRNEAPAIGESLLSQTTERIRHHLYTTHPEKFFDMPWADMSLTKRIRDMSKTKNSIVFPQTLQFTFRQRSRDMADRQVQICEQLGILRALQSVTSQLDQIASIVPREYFDELFDIDMPLSGGNLYKPTPTEETSQSNHIPQELISEIFGYISKSRTRQCLDALAYNKKLHDSIEVFRDELMVASARSGQENVNAQRDYTLLVIHYCEMQKQQTRDAKQIDWYSECQIVAKEVQSHYGQSFAIPDRESFVATARKLEKNVSRFDQFRVSPLAKYLQRHYAIHATLAFMKKAFTEAEIDTYALLYTHHVKTHRLSFESFLWYMRSFRSIFKRDHLTQLRQSGEGNQSVQIDSTKVEDRFEKPVYGAPRIQPSVAPIIVPRAFHANT